MTSKTSGVRILFTGQYWPGANSLYIARAFEQSGAVIRWLNDTNLWPEWSSFAGRVARRLLHPLVEAEWNRQLLQSFNTFKPDLVYITNADYCWPKTLDFIHKHGVPIMCFYHDPPWQNRPGSRFAENITHFDLIATTRHWHEAEFKAAGAKAVAVVRFGYEPLVHRPVTLNNSLYQQYAADITFIGSYRAHRLGDLTTLTATDFPYSFRIWGNQWDRIESSDPIRRYWQGRDVLEQEMPFVYAASKVALHWVNWEPHSTDLALQRGDQHNSRTFQIAACGGAIMIAQRTQEHQELFKEDVEAVFFDAEPELRSKLAYWLAPERESQRRQMALAARQRCITQDYSYVPVVLDFLFRLGFTDSTVRNDVG
ncbi:MAG: glycosyltransferase family 1 protein [Anaerolineae bacterium]|nr:glycosyltransferase family 1 protein [Anaerolineae bacterium]